MALETYTITNFGGLNEVDPPDDVGIETATALADVEWDRSTGSIRQRYGSANFLASAESRYFTALYAHSSSRLLGFHSIAGTPTVEAYNASGTSLTSTTTSLYASFATIGTPSATYTYIGDTGSAGVMQRYDGTSFSSPSGMPRAYYVAVQPNDNRLVAAGTLSSSSATDTIDDAGGFTLPQATITVDDTTGFATSGVFYVTSTTGTQEIAYTGTTGTTFTGCSGGTGDVADNATVTAYCGPGGAVSSPSHVWFSQPGAPETWRGEEETEFRNFVILTPGDGEDIRAVVAWRNSVFVFKRSRIFVFYGNSTDEDGNAVFNYRTIELSPSERVWGSAYTPIACAGPDGVYYAGETGVMMTTGDTPMNISAPLDWDDSNQSATGYAALPSIAGERLYITSYQAGTNGIYFYDFPTGQWGKLSLGSASNVLHWKDTQTLYADHTAFQVRYLGRVGDTDDAGTAIAASWTSGISNLGYEGEKRLKYIDVWGTGTVSLSVASNFGSPTNATTLTLGSSTVDRTRYKISAVGHFFGIKFASVAGAAWKVHRVVLHYEATANAQHDRT